MAVSDEAGNTLRNRTGSKDRAGSKEATGGASEKMPMSEENPRAGGAIGAVDQAIDFVRSISGSKERSRSGSKEASGGDYQKMQTSQEDAVGGAMGVGDETVVTVHSRAESKERAGSKETPGNGGQNMQTSQEEEEVQNNTQPGPAPLAKPPPACPAKLVLFCCNLFIGLGFSQVIPELMDTDTYSVWKHVVKAVTMCCVSYIMFHVGLEFEIDKKHLSKYVTEYLVAMTAAGFPWLFCAVYFMFALGPAHNLPWQQALIAARFAAPTSAGILFTMLEAAGMKETWIFKKARILAIFDDLDTLLLMVPLKAVFVGPKWELSIDLIFVTILLFIMYRYLHRVDVPTTWPFICLYSVGVAFFCEMVHFLTSSELTDPTDLADTVHLEVLLPAFTVGCIVKHDHEAEHGAAKHHGLAGMVSAGTVKTCISAVFMVLVGFSMPALFTNKHELGGHRRLAGASPSTKDHHSEEEAMDAGMIVVHVIVCTILMNIGKLFPAFCYKKEVNRPTRVALAVAMMPRGEVCAGIIVNAIALGITGPSITIAVFCLALNMMMVSGFIFIVKILTGFSSSRLTRSFSTFSTQQEVPSTEAEPGVELAAEATGKAGSEQHQLGGRQSQDTMTLGRSQDASI